MGDQQLQNYLEKDLLKQENVEFSTVGFSSEIFFAFVSVLLVFPPQLNRIKTDKNKNSFFIINLNWLFGIL